MVYNRIEAMSQLFMACIYGVSVIVILYLFVRMLYSVNYTPGITTLYNSSVAQKLFPNEPNKLFPSWGYNRAGMLKRDPTKYDQGDFWPESGNGFKPTANGSGGPSPSGGMRSGGTGPVNAPIGWWKGDITYPSLTITSIYGDESIPEPTVSEVGWWGKE